MRKLWSPIVFAMTLVACSSTDIGPNRPDAQYKANEQLAIQNVMCAFEPHPQGKQSPCAHMIENRLLLGKFFQPLLPRGVTEAERNKARRLTTKFVVEAAARIKQCRKVPLENTINIIRDVKIAGGTYLLRGTSPLSEENSSCFLTPEQEGS